MYCVGKVSTQWLKIFFIFSDMYCVGKVSTRWLYHAIYSDCSSSSIVYCVGKEKKLLWTEWWRSTMFSHSVEGGWEWSSIASTRRYFLLRFPTDMRQQILNKPLNSGVCGQFTMALTFWNFLQYHINSISLNSDCETFISADDLRINLWNLAIRFVFLPWSCGWFACWSVESGDSV